MKCPCGSQLDYQHCCGQYIDGDKLPATAEALMRSRFTAYAQANIEYIDKTMQGPATNNFNPVSAKEWAETCQWQRLQVLKSQAISANQAYVEFIAHYTSAGRQQYLHEVSEFRRIQGRWYYVDGEQPIISRNPNTKQNKVGRNDPCPCGSGKKYKKCCGL